ncbi:MAG: copper chaperone PCu(A)C, partial [Acidimicrobiia bacterium]
MRYSIGLLAMALAACSSASGVLAISDSWAPSMPPNAPTAAIYLTIDNETGIDDQLLTVSSPRCGTTEIHS